MIMELAKAAPVHLTCEDLAICLGVRTPQVLDLLAICDYPENPDVYRATRAMRDGDRRDYAKIFSLVDAQGE
jgi:hypothetical protein